LLATSDLGASVTAAGFSPFDGLSASATNEKHAYIEFCVLFIFIFYRFT